METVKEGKAVIKAAGAGVVSRDMPVFYNPVMKMNRDFSVAVLNCFEKNDMQIVLPLAATGVRGIRLALELKPGKIRSIQMNDHSNYAFGLMKENIKLNGVKGVEAFNLDANLFVLGCKGFDYADIDPFGSPNFLLDSCAKRVSRGGMIAVTATDTAPLCGTYRKACIRKYGSVPLRNEFYNETGLRILIRKVQVVAAQYDKALVPVFSYSRDHYFRVFFLCLKGKDRVDDVMGEMGFVVYCRKCLFRDFVKGIFNSCECDCGGVLEHGGPLWLGKLNDSGFVKKMIGFLDDKKLAGVVYEESLVGSAGFYDIAMVCKRYKISKLPRKADIISCLKREGFRASETHFRPNSIRSDVGIERLVDVLKGFSE